jgi:hypothetical protein
MIVRRILFFVFLLGTWAQAAGACTEAHAAPAPVQQAMEIALPAVSEDFAVIGARHCCECPAIVQNVQLTASESSKFLLASYVEGAGGVPNSSNPGSVALAVRTRASSFIARRSAQSPYLLALPLRL